MPAFAQESLLSAEVFRNYVGGDDRAGESIFDRFFDPLRQMAGRLIGNTMARRIDADDVVQAALASFFVKARRGRYSISRSGQLWSLLAKITTSKARKLAEEHTAQCRNVYRESPGGVPASSVGDSDDPVISAILLDEIDAALRSVSQREADVFRLALIGESVREIASIFGCCVSTVHRAIARVQCRLEARLS